MREIEFRGKNKDLGWFHGNLFIPDKGYERLEICIGSSACRITYEVDPESVGQYIGKKDKNGKKIYEGDILKIDMYPFLSDGVYNYSAQACYDIEEGCFFFYTFKNKEAKVAGGAVGNTYVLSQIDSEDIEIIGNIYDNPELLED